jgi:hypothetical protein
MLLTQRLGTIQYNKYSSRVYVFFFSKKYTTVLKCKLYYSYNQCCGPGSASGQIRTFLVGSGSGRLGPDPVPDPDPGLNK